MIINTHPFTRINDRSFFTNDLLINKIETLKPDLETLRLSTSSPFNGYYQFDTIQYGFLCIITETVFNYPTTYISEKSFKGITAKRPFVIFSSKGSLQQLKDMGFKTFSNWWDESYDSIVDPEERFLAVYSIITDICNKPVEELKEMCREMTEILEYNFNWYKDSMHDSEIENVKSQLEKL